MLRAAERGDTRRAGRRAHPLRARERSGDRVHPDQVPGRRRSVRLDRAAAVGADARARYRRALHHARQSTLPQYRLTRQQNYCGGSQPITNGDGCSAFALGGDDTTAAASYDTAFVGIRRSSDMAAGGIVVEQASIGPYDYAVLKADDETAMLQWLADNRYFVPAGTADAPSRTSIPAPTSSRSSCAAAQTTGDIAPIVLRYTSDLPMIPITLTSGRRRPNMGVLVWVARRGARDSAQLLPRRPRRSAGLVLQLPDLQPRDDQRRARSAGQARLHHAVRRLERARGQPARLRRALRRSGDAARARRRPRTICTTCSRTATASTARWCRSCRATSPSRRSSSNGRPAAAVLSKYDNYSQYVRHDPDGGALRRRSIRALPPTRSPRAS